MIDRTCCRSAFCSRSHCSGKFENFSDIWKNCFLQKMMNVRETKIMKNKRAICITIICVLGVLILLLLLFSHLNHGNLYNGNQAIANTEVQRRLHRQSE